MKKSKETELDFIIDKLTNSIENVVTGDSFATEISVMTTNDLKTATKKIDLDVDFIGGQGSLTETEEKELRKFFKESKKRLKTGYISSRPNKRPNVTI